MGVLEILQTLKLDAASEREYQKCRIAEAEAQECEKELERRSREQEYEFYDRNKEVFYNENATIKFTKHIPEINRNVEVVVVGLKDVYVYVGDNVYYIEVMGKDRFSWCQLGVGDYSYMSYPSVKRIHDFSEANSNTQNVFMNAVALYIRAAFYNTQILGNYNSQKCEEMVVVANKEFQKIGMNISRGEQICCLNTTDSNFLYREFCKEYLNRK